MATNSTPASQSKVGFVEKKDKRKQNRLQGGWNKDASGNRGGRRPGGNKPNNRPHDSAYGQFQPTVPQHTGYGGANYGDAGGSRIGQPQDVGRSGFVFQTPDENQLKQVHNVHKETTLTEDGTYTLSDTEHGKSSIQLTRQFVAEDEAARMFESLVDEVNWSRKIITKPDGTEYAEPRKTFWFGAVPYSYSRVTMESCQEWHPIIAHLKQRIEAKTGYTFNSVLCNLYEHCKDGVQWHSDDEYSLGVRPTIASVSLGAMRRFQLRDKHGELADNPEHGEYVVHLTSGSLLMMLGATQNDWQHRVPREYHDREPRINLTFRTIYEDDRSQQSPFFSQQFDSQ